MQESRMLPVNEAQRRSSQMDGRRQLYEGKRRWQFQPRTREAFEFPHKYHGFTVGDAVGNNEVNGINMYCALTVAEVANKTAEFAEKYKDDLAKPNDRKLGTGLDRDDDTSDLDVSDVFGKFEA